MGITCDGNGFSHQGVNDEISLEIKKETSKVYKERNIQKMITSKLLKRKIKEMNVNLYGWLSSKVSIDAKVYCRNSDEFKEVPNHLIEPHSLHLN